LQSKRKPEKYRWTYPARPVIISAVLPNPKNIHGPKRCAVRSSASARRQRHPQVRELWENIERHNLFR
jgi:hypothetical protein